jgi:hypothetical protein
LLSTKLTRIIFKRHAAPQTYHDGWGPIWATVDAAAEDAKFEQVVFIAAADRVSRGRNGFGGAFGTNWMCIKNGLMCASSVSVQIPDPSFPIKSIHFERFFGGLFTPVGDIVCHRFIPRLCIVINPCNQIIMSVFAFIPSIYLFLFIFSVGISVGCVICHIFATNFSSLFANHPIVLSKFTLIDSHLILPPHPSQPSMLIE